MASVEGLIELERYKGVCGRYVAQTWLDNVLNQSGFDEWARNIYFTTHKLRAYVCVNYQTKNPANCRIFSEPEARRCVFGHINGTKLCRESLKGYTRIPITDQVIHITMKLICS